MLELKEFKLDNGFSVLNIHNANIDTVTLMLLVGVGSRFEKQDLSGISHFVEHTFFKGSNDFPTSKSIGMAIEGLGGVSNAFTSYEYTGYYIKVPKENFEKALAILSDIIKNPLFPDGELEKERGVIIEEIRMYEDIPMRKVESAFMTGFFGKEHPLGWDIAGNVKSVSGLDRVKVVDFVKENYVSKNMLMVVSGGIDSASAKASLEHSFSSLPSETSTTTFNPVDTNKLNLGQTFITPKDLEQTHIVMGGLGVKRSFEKRFALRLGLAILSQGFGSLLFQTIREKLGLAYYISASHTGFNETGYWDVSMGVDNNRVKEALDAVITELQNFKKGEFDSDDFERGKNYLLGNLVTELESSDDTAYWFGIQKLLLGEIQSISEVKSIILKINKDEVLEVWSDLIKEGNLSMALLTKVEGLDLSDLIKKF